ncbi:MAG: hypothetical protein SVC26_08460 [Pseudomonadota bacterium]|nr:hypothetical protein [Pseudomonadota bacterium]
MKYVPKTTVTTKTRFDVYVDGVKKMETFDAFTAQAEIDMGWGNVEVKTVEVAA